MRRIFTSYLAVLTQICLAQTSPQIIGDGHDFPSQPVAPGQVVTFWMAGAKTVFPPGQPNRTADTVPLPTNLAGFSVSFLQYPPEALLPIFSVQQVNFCLDQGAPPSCTLTGITVQLPMEMGLPGSGGDAVRIPGVSIAIIENGTRTDSFSLDPQADSIHILTRCDPISLNPGVGCLPKITHADGALLTTPAAVGESLTMYAVGLGVTNPPVPAGTLTPGPVPMAAYEQPTILYNYVTDPSLPAGSATSPPAAAAVITYAGLAPGEIGVYQINFVVPSPPPNARICSLKPFSPNLTVYLAGALSVDSAKICVNLPDKVASGVASSQTTRPGPQAPRSTRPLTPAARTIARVADAGFGVGNKRLPLTLD